MSDEFRGMNDDEIRERCRQICRHCLTAEEAIEQINDWSGLTPAIIFCSNGRDRMFMGVIFSPSGDIISF